MRRSHHTGYLLFLNRSPIFWYSERQQTVLESSTLCSLQSLFIALKACVECAGYTQYKLHMFGVPIMFDGHSSTNILFCDNDSVVKNIRATSNLSSTRSIPPSHHIINYVRWAVVAAGVVTIAWISSQENNLADPFTKRLAATVLRD
jgi:hypothetical protein